MKSVIQLAIAAVLAASTPAPVLAQMPVADTAPAAVRPGAYRLDKAHAKLEWALSHLGFSTYSGEFTAFDAQLTLDPARIERASLSVTIDMTSVETNNDTLDGHLRSPDFFDAGRFSTATYRSTRIVRTGARSARVLGDLTLHGVTRQVPLLVTFNASGVNPVSKAYTVGFSATAEIDRTQFGITSYAPAIGSTVRLTLNGEFNPLPAAS